MDISEILSRFFLLYNIPLSAFSLQRKREIRGGLFSVNMAKEQTVLRFDEVSFEFQYKKPILDEVNLTVRSGSKLTLMGQNGAGKSTLFKLITGELKAKEGKIFIGDGVKIGTARQVIARDELDFTLEEYFNRVYTDKIPYNARGEMGKVLNAVNLDMPLDRKVRDLSGGQQARLLLAFALLQDPDILLLDEPTNNLDDDGIDHLIQFLIMYDKTVIVISHDADFLNSFTDGVIYLDVFTHKIEQYVGDYYSVVDEIAKRIEREQKQNAQLEREIKDKKEKINFFAHKGGKMRKLAQKMRDDVYEAEENMVDIRREDKSIRDFEIPVQDISGKLIEIDYVGILKNYEVFNKELNIALHKGDHMLLSGPNGIGKSTWLRKLAEKKAEGSRFMEGLKIGYYSQDFSALNYEQTVYDYLHDKMLDGYEPEDLRRTAAKFLITGDLMGRKISDLSEGQKGLLSFTQLVLEEPGLIILDEPTNHINFRHLPVIAEALDNYKGAMILVSHMKEFTNQIRFQHFLDLGKI